MELYGRPLTFGDDEQIKEIKRIEVKTLLKQDKDFQRLKSNYKDIEVKIEKLEKENEETYAEMLEIARPILEKYDINEKYLVFYF